MLTESTRALAQTGVGALDRLALYASSLAFKLNLPVRAKVMMGGAPVPVVLRDRSDRVVLKEMAQTCDYDAVAPPDPAVIIDVGANIGFSALYFASRFPEATIHAIEPSPSTYARLAVNTRHNPRIKTYNLGIGAADGVGAFHTAPTHFSSSFVDRSDVTQAQTTEVPIMRLDTFRRQHRIDRVGLLKIDVEGFEVQAFEGLDLAGVTQLAVEVHYDLMPKPREWFLERMAGFEVTKRDIKPGVREILFAVRGAG